MPVFMKKLKRRESTSVRDREVHKLYDEIVKDLGEVGMYVSKDYIYRKIQAKTKLSIRTISFIINHT